jgi:GAF domain-containing protein
MRWLDVRYWPKADILPWRESGDLPRIEHRREPPGADMQRRGGSGQPVKGRGTTRHKGRKAPALVSSDLSAEQFDRLKRERNEALEQLAATSEVLEVISRSAFDLKSVLQTLVESAARLCKADKAAITRQIGGQFFFTEIHGFSPEFIDYVRTLPVKPERGTVTGVALLEGRTVHVPDVRVPRDRIWAKAQRLGGFRTMLGVPMLREGIPIGVLGLARSEVHPFTDKQIELVQNFANQAVIAIANAELLNELRQRTDDLSESLGRQTATSEVLKVISTSPGELEPVFNAMLEHATRICEAKFGMVFQFDGERFHCIAEVGTPPLFAEFLKQQGPFQPLKGSHLDRIRRTKQVSHTADYAAEGIASPPVKFGGARSTVDVPMLKDDELIGAFSIYRQEVRPFTDKQIALLTNFAAQAVIAIENTRLLNELRQRTDDLSEALEQQTATSEVLRVISSSPGELAPVFNAILENATHICEATFGNLFLRDGPIFRSVAVHSTKGHVDSWRRNPVFDLRDNPGVPLDRVANTKQVVHISDLRNDPSYIGKNARVVTLVEVTGARTYLSVPMLKEGELIGAISMFRQEVRPFTDKQIELVKNFAAQAVIAIENTRLLKELRESLQQQTATADVLKVISRSTFDLQTVLDTLAESAARLCDADQSFLNRREGENYVWAASYGFSQEAVEFRKSRPLTADPGTATGRAIAEGKIVHIPDVLEDKEYTNWEAQKLNRFRAVLGVPLLREGVPMGVFALTRFTPRSFTEKQIELVSTFADQAAIAIENVRLFESVETRTRELAKSLEELRTAQDRLVQTEKLASLGQLTAGIAHEIKNPLNFVNNFSGVSTELIDELQDALNRISIDHKARAEIKELTDTLRGNLDKVVQHGKRADAIVKNMLLHSRAGSGEHRPVDINAIVEESLSLAWHGARAEKQGFNITLEKSFDPTAGEADVFPQEITRALLNLISNGFYAATKRKAEANGGDYEPTLAATTKNLGDRVEIRIRDNGTGIPPEVKDKLFNPFFTTKPAGEGTGLGLSICHDIIVKQHGGSIEVDTQPGEFTEIRVTLPRVAASLS